jgi:hypothetical protein
VDIFGIAVSEIGGVRRHLLKSRRAERPGQERSARVDARRREAGIETVLNPQFRLIRFSGRFSLHESTEKCVDRDSHAAAAF